MTARSPVILAILSRGSMTTQTRCGLARSTMERLLYGNDCCELVHWQGRNRAIRSVSVGATRLMPSGICASFTDHMGSFAMIPHSGHPVFRLNKLSFHKYRHGEMRTGVTRSVAVVVTAAGGPEKQHQNYAEHFWRRRRFCMTYPWGVGGSQRRILLGRLFSPPAVHRALQQEG